MKKGKRRGAAVVEFAVATPVILLIAFGVLELTNGIFLKQSITVAAYEGARVSILPDTNASNVQLAAERILNGRGVVGASVSVTPANLASAAFGDPITVDVSVPLGQNRVFSNHFGANSTLDVSVTMMKEQ